MSLFRIPLNTSPIRFVICVLVIDLSSASVSGSGILFGFKLELELEFLLGSVLLLPVDSDAELDALPNVEDDPIDTKSFRMLSS